jgi:hypothetical protein
MLIGTSLGCKHLLLARMVRSNFRGSADEQDLSFEGHEKDELLYEDKEIGI